MLKGEVKCYLPKQGFAYILSKLQHDYTYNKYLSIKKKNNNNLLHYHSTSSTHNKYAQRAGVARESRLEHVLFACDEMAGFVTPASLVRPSKSVLDLEAKSVKKRMKDKAFARGVSRDDLRLGAEEIGLPLDDHITNVITFMRAQAGAIGLRGSL